MPSLYEALQLTFMRNALLAGLLVSLACGIIGTFVVVNRIVFIGGGIAHAAYGGIGLGYFLAFNPVWGAVLFSVISALGMGVIQLTTPQRADTLIGVVWVSGMALGVFLVDLTQGYKVDLMSYLFGSILTVPTPTLWTILALDLVIVLLVWLFYKEFVALSFDKTFAAAANVPVSFLSLLLIVLIALTVVMTMQVVGLMMVIALLTIPAAISAMVVRTLRAMAVVASVLGMLFTTCGIVLSYTLNLTSGATIILIASAVYILALAIQATSRMRRRL